jgi:hypothetical protein
MAASFSGGNTHQTASRLRTFHTSFRPSTTMRIAPGAAAPASTEGRCPSSGGAPASAADMRVSRMEGAKSTSAASHAPLPLRFSGGESLATPAPGCADDDASASARGASIWNASWRACASERAWNQSREKVIAGSRQAGRA